MGRDCLRPETRGRTSACDRHDLTETEHWFADFVYFSLLRHQQPGPLDRTPGERHTGPDPPAWRPGPRLVGGHEILVLARVDAIAEALATAAHIDAANHDEVRDAGPSTPVSRLPAPDRLTPREVEVLRLLAAGHSNPEIAAALVLSVKTVERHLANLYAKIGVRNRVDAATHAVTHILQ